MAVTHVFWIRLGVFAFVLSLLFYMVVIPSVGMFFGADGNRPAVSMVNAELTPAEFIRVKSAEAATAFWFFALGASLGSFLNVVVYRWPRKESVVWQRSHCPQCGQAIRGRDNIPVAGWLLLGGKCRSCRTPISAQYVIAELVLGGVFLLLFFSELISGGTNLPIRTPNLHAGIVWIIFYTKWDLVCIYLYHGWMFGCLMMLALLAKDRQIFHRLQWTLLTLSLLLPPIAAPWLLMVPTPDAIYSGSSFDLFSSTVSTLLMSMIAGVVIAGLSGWLAIGLERESHDRWEIVLWAFGVLWLSIVMGPWATLRISSMAILFAMVGCRLEWLKLPTAIFLAAVVHHPFWRWWDQVSPVWMPGAPTASIVWLTIQGLGLALLAILYRIAFRPVGR